MKEIENIVFYNFIGEDGERKQACIFYKDGTVKNVSYENGISACEEVARERKLTSGNEFESLVDNGLIHIMSGKEFETRFSEFVPKKHHRTILSKIKDKYNTKKVRDSEKNDNYDIDVIDEELEDKGIENIVAERPSLLSRIKSGIKSGLEKIKNSGIARGVISVATAIGLVVGGNSFALSHKNMSGKMLNSNLVKTEASIDESKTSQREIPLIGNNKYYDNYSYNQLVKVTQCNTQKKAMSSLKDTLVKFNGDFANHYLENGKDIRAGLKVDEVSALQVAYNDYSKEEIKKIFNGTEMRKSDMTNAYKDATLQLMGAYVIETPDCPVNMSGLLETDEAKAYYNKMHDLFINASCATGQDKLEKVNEFYTQVRNDFAICEKERTEGISHSKSRSSLKSYQLSVVPMIAAGEMMWQNLDVDLTLDDTSVDFLNDIGLCNYAEDSFERVENITLCADEDTKNPTYEQYREAIDKLLVEKGIEVTTDEHRELSNLQAFQDKVNYNYKNNECLQYSSGYDTLSSYSTGSSKIAKGTTSSKTTYHREEKRTPVSREQVPAGIREQLEGKINSKIEKENAAAKEKAEKEACKVKEQLQNEEDKKAEKLREEIKKEDKEFQNDIAKANKTIDDNNSDENESNDTNVNENDFKSKVEFDNEHSDNKGNLDKSVEHVTTDSSGSSTKQNLPDPSATGAKFDSSAKSTTTQSSNTNNSSSSYSQGTSSSSSYSHQASSTSTTVQQKPAPTTNTSSSNSSSSCTTQVQAPSTSAPAQTNEEAVNSYVESLANQQTEDATCQYTK